MYFLLKFLEHAVIPSKWREESGPLPVWFYGSRGTGNPKFSFLALLEVEGMTLSD